jgi:hypothetical protein
VSVDKVEYGLIYAKDMIHLKTKNQLDKQNTHTRLKTTLATLKMRIPCIHDIKTTYNKLKPSAKN